MAGRASAQQPLELTPPLTGTSGSSPQPIELSQSQARASVQWLADLALSKLPRRIDGNKDWGNTKKLWAGVKVRLDGLKVRTKRRWREVEHGRWVQYEVMLPPPAAHSAVSVQIHQVIPYLDPLSGNRRWRIDASITAPMTFKARIQRWNLGVRLFSMTVSGEMHVRMRTLMSVGFLAEYDEIPPALVVDPRVEQAQLHLQWFEVNRISHLGGDVAEGWGELLQEILVERLVKKQNEKLVGKLNKSIDKERDDLRLSIADWFEQW